MARVKNGDNELALYRNLLEPPKEFLDGFGWSTVIGILFCGFIMMPGAIYLGLMTGGNLGAAATWVTLILFGEVARRALKSMSKQQLIVLLHAAGGIMGGQALFGTLVYRAYFVTSEAVRDAGMRDCFPSWFAPHPDSPAILERNLFHGDWMVPIIIVAALMVISTLNRYTLGYFFFRLTSDIEKLPFPLAPISAQGAMAMAEAEEARGSSAGAESAEGAAALLAMKRGEKKKSDRWRIFTLGTTIGVVFGLLQVGIPAISGLFLDKPFYLIPQPFVDTTTLTESVLPAAPTGIAIDLGLMITGMVLPFWAVMGSAAAIIATIIVNPTLHHFGVLARWQPGMNAVNAAYANNVDFWMSFGIGSAFAIAVASIFQTVRDVRRRTKEMKAQLAVSPDTPRESIWATPKSGRGDWPMWLAIGGYVVISVIQLVFCYIMLRGTGTAMHVLLIFLFVFIFIYNPFISYVNARLLGISGQSVDIPFIKETAFILSGAKGVEVWLAPIPIANYGAQAQSFRVNELTGVSFRSLFKADLVILPVMFLLSWFFWGFIWKGNAIPSDVFPTAQINWELQAKNEALLYSSTFTPPGAAEHSILDSEFMQAVHPGVIGTAFLLILTLFGFLQTMGWPTLFVYGLIRGFGSWPHNMLFELAGCLIGRYIFQKKFGRENFLRMVPTILAGYFTGVGLISMATIAMRLIQSAVSSAPF